MSFRSSLVCLFLLAAILILAESPNSFWVAPALSQESSVSNNGLVRQEVSMTNNQWLGLKQGLLAVFPKQVFGHPAKPEGILFQVSDDTLVMDYDPIRKVLRIEGRRSVASALARIANTFAMESTVAKDRSFRVFHLTSDGQEALAEFAEPEQLASRNPREPRQQKSSGIRLASGFQDPSGETVVIGGQPETQDERKGSPEKLPLPQFEGVQIEMLPELDAVILRGRDQQLTDLSEIIKRLDEASRESKPRIEVVNLQQIGRAHV